MRKRIKKERRKKEKNKVTIVTAGIKWVKKRLYRFKTYVNYFFHY